MRYTQEDLQRLLEENTRSLVDDLSSNAVLCSIRILDAAGKLLVSVSRFSSEPSPIMPELEPTIPVGGPDGGIIGGGHYGDDGQPVHTVGGDAVLTQTVQEVQDLSRDKRFSNQKIIEAGYTSMIAMPIIFSGLSKGVAQIYSKTRNYLFSKREKRMAETICDNLAHVLVIKELKEEVERLQKKAVENEMFRLIGEHAGAVTHIIKNKVGTAMPGFALRIKRLAETGSPSAENLAKIARSADAILQEHGKLESSLKHILSIGKRPPKLQPVDICALLSSVLDRFPTEIKDGKKVRIVRNFRANATLMIDPEQITELVEELLQNAVEAAAQYSDDAVITCRTSLYDGKYHSLRIEVENDGEIPIPIDQMNKIFDPFFTTKENGSGLGLFDARVTVKRHDGEIVVKSGNGKTIVRVYLPR